MEIKAAGEKEASDFLSSEPELSEYIDTVAKGAMSRIFKGIQADTEVLEKASEEIRFSMIKVLLITRQCYRDLSVKMLEQQLELETDEPEYPTE